MNRIPTRWIVCLLLLGLSFPAVAERKPPPLTHHLMPVKTAVPAPDFTLENMDEEKIRLSDYRGKVVLLNFWATWCPPCVREMPSMERLQQQVAADDFKIIAVNQMEDVDQVFIFSGQLPVDLTFSIALDRDSAVSRAYEVRGLPTTYLIDKKGVIRYRAVGGREFDHPQVVETIRQLISEP